MSSFRGEDLFSSGPHHFIVRRVGTFVRAGFVFPNDSSVPVAYGKAAIEIEQVGRLVAGTSAALWALFDAIRLHAESGVSGALVTETSKTFEGVALYEFSMTGPIERGRDWSMPYIARYTQIDLTGVTVVAESGGGA